MVDRQAEKNAQLEEIARMCGRTLQEQLGDGIGFSLVLYDLAVANGSVAFAHNGGKPFQVGGQLIDVGNKLQRGQIAESLRLLGPIDGLGEALSTLVAPGDEDMSAAQGALELLRAAERAAGGTVDPDVVLKVLALEFSRVRVAAWLGAQAMLPPGSKIHVELPEAAPTVKVAKAAKSAAKPEYVIANPDPVRFRGNPATDCARCGRSVGSAVVEHHSESDAHGSFLVCSDLDACQKRWWRRFDPMPEGADLRGVRFEAKGRTFLVVKQPEADGSVFSVFPIVDGPTAELLDEMVTDTMTGERKR